MAIHTAAIKAQVKTLKEGQDHLKDELKAELKELISELRAQEQRITATVTAK